MKKQLKLVLCAVMVALCAGAYAEDSDGGATVFPIFNVGF